MKKQDKKQNQAAYFALLRAIAKAGGQSALARKLGTSQARVYFWLTRNKKGVPAELVQKIEEVTGVPRYELRPDLWEKV